LDATAGLGRDAFVLASLGCQVHLLERSPIVAALLADGLRRAKADVEKGEWLSQRLSLEHCDALIWMKEHPNAYHSVYLDPMYPHRRKSALVKKEMQILRSSVGEDADAAALLEMALCCAQKRVVVKRPKGAECLDKRQPQAQIIGKTTRFDLYLKDSMKAGNS
jgi:16S rRNA (guanine1516-N2)-methyltransferase